MTQMRLKVDWKRITEDLGRLKERDEAVLATLRGAGVGEVVTSIRKKLPHERGTKVPHGAMIANILRNIGHDPFAYPEATMSECQQFLTSELSELLESAWRQGRPQVAGVRRIQLAAAWFLADSVVERVTGGGLGQTSGKRYAKRKAILTNKGRGTRKYGNPPPVGILTGRFIEGVRARWRGKRGK